MTMTVDSTARPASDGQKDAHCMTLEDRMVRIDTLLCILFAGLTSHPMAKVMIPEDELEKLRAILPQD